MADKGVSPGHKSSGDTGRLSDVIREWRHLAGAKEVRSEVQDRERHAIEARF